MNYLENDIFTPDISTDKTPTVYPCVKTEKSKYKVIEAVTEQTSRAIAFANEINENVIGDFERETDKMCHVSTFCFADNNIFVSYYANGYSNEENPDFQSARIAFAPMNDIKNKTVLDVQCVGDVISGHTIKKVYDTILLQRDDDKDNIYVLFTALVDDQYYRLYRIFNIKTKALGETLVNRFKVGNAVNDFSTSGIKTALTYNGIGYKSMRSDIGIMQKLTSRIENGKKYYYTGAYSGDFNCIIKSDDLLTWEYVAQPVEGKGAFPNDTLWENAVYVTGDKAYYFIRQWEASIDENGNPIKGDNRNEQGCLYGILTVYDLEKKEWTKPVLVGDSQSRSDFIMYKNGLYLFHAPINRNHIGILKINRTDIEKSEVVLQADMKGSCFYPFVQYDTEGNIYMSYTVDRKHIRISKFTFEKYIPD